MKSKISRSRRKTRRKGNKRCINKSVPISPDSVMYRVGFLILGDDECIEMVAWFREHYLAQIMRRVDADAIDHRWWIERKIDFIALRKK